MYLLEPVGGGGVGWWPYSTNLWGIFLRIVVLDWRKKIKIEETLICVFLEIYGIPYMKKVTEFREIPRNFTELYVTEFGGIPPEFLPIPHGIRNRRK